MNLDDVRAAVDAVRDAARALDDETAHGREIALHVAVLRELATHWPADGRALVVAALETRVIEFQRWHA